MRQQSSLLARSVLAVLLLVAGPTGTHRAAASNPFELEGHQMPPSGTTWCVRVQHGHSECTRWGLFGCKEQTCNTGALVNLDCSVITQILCPTEGPNHRI